VFRGPVAVLVDRGTASGAEVIASALQEYGAGHLIGTRTCGCLSVGRPLQLGDSSGLIVTVEQAFTGRMERSLEGTGLEPDLRVNSPDPLREAQAYVISQLR
jgi:carboxyl-terminal processing protease